MQADMETQSAAKLHIPHLRRSAGTGARSALNRLLSCSRANWLADNSACRVFTARSGHSP